jgi:hypothetical protein
MSDTTITTERDAKTGRFLKGYKGGGRPLGSRNRFSEQFIADMSAHWREHGPDVIARAAKEDPSGFIKAVASLMPRDLHLTVGIDDLSSREDVYREIIEHAGSAQAALAGLDAIRVDIERMASDEAKVIEPE